MPLRSILEIGMVLWQQTPFATFQPHQLSISAKVNGVFDGHIVAVAQSLRAGLQIDFRSRQ
jgi:hypothetical protein